METQYVQTDDGARIVDWRYIPRSIQHRVELFSLVRNYTGLVGYMLLVKLSHWRHSLCMPALIKTVN